MRQSRTGLPEEFLVRFNALRAAVKYEPRRLAQFYSQSPKVKEASDSLYWFMFTSRLESMVEHGKRFQSGLPDRFRPDYEDYKRNWQEAIGKVSGIRIDLGQLGLERPDQGTPTQAALLEEPPTEDPDYDFDESFDPRLHNAGKVLDAGIGYLADKAEDDCNDDYIRNLCRIAVEGSDYIVGVVGLDLIAASERYRSIPVTFVPSHVSRMDSAAGGLLALLDEAVLAYAAGAPNASIAMCRAVLERVLKRHYGRDSDDKYEDDKDRNLAKLIDFCGSRYAWVARQKKPLHDLRRLANQSLHTTSAGSLLSPDDEQILVNAFGNLRFLIEKAPTNPK